MAFRQDPSTIVNTGVDPALTRFSATGSQTTTTSGGNTNIYINQVTNRQQVTNFVNRPGGNVDELQFRNSSGSFSGDKELKYDAATDTLTLAGTMVVNSIKTNNYYYANGGRVPVGYNNNSVAAFLPSYSGNLNPGNLSVSGLASLGDVGNVKIDGGISGQVLTTDGDGGLYWSTTSVANANYSSFSGVASVANSVSGSNVVGTVANANYSSFSGVAYSVSGSNVTGTVANANYAAFAGTVSFATNSGTANVANSVSGSNVVGTVANATYSVNSGTANIANSVNGSNVSGTVANATYAINSGNASIAFSVSGGNVVGTVANATYAVTAGSVANANYANFAGQVVDSSQPNITSVGTLNSLAVIGTTDLNDLSNISITGGSNGQVLSTNGSGLLSWVDNGSGGGTSLPYLELTNTGFVGNAVDFVKTNYGSEVDNIDTDVAITRGDNQGIFNPLVESGWDQNVSPANTEWNSDGWSDLTDVTSRVYKTFYAAVGGNLGDNVLGLELVMHDTVNNKYYTVIFTAWTQGNNGGGFAYTRHELATSALQTGVTFADGTVQKTAYTGNNTTKTWTNPNDNVWRIEEYSSGVAVNYNHPTANYNTTATIAASFSGTLVIDSNIDSGVTLPLNSLSIVEYNGNAYTYNGWSQNAGVYTISFNTPFPTYTPGDTVTLIYTDYNTPPEPVVWWDAANSPSGSSIFRGAIIEYHAYTNNSGTIIGTIHMVNDDEYTVTHTEVTSGVNDLANVVLWDTTNSNGRQLYFKRTDNNSDQVFIQWTSKIFYGSEYYC